MKTGVELSLVLRASPWNSARLVGWKNIVEAAHLSAVRFILRGLWTGTVTYAWQNEDNHAYNYLMFSTKTLQFLRLNETNKHNYNENNTTFYLPVCIKPTQSHKNYYHVIKFETRGLKIYESSLLNHPQICQSRNFLN